MPYTAPAADTNAFNCPHCGAFAQQTWIRRNWTLINVGSDVASSTCTHCSRTALWVAGKMFYPDWTNAPLPNADLPDKVKELYGEAASISSKSPRAAAALLRLAVEVLCKELVKDANDLNQAIGSLVKGGLPKQIQMTLDILRVTGNNAVHPGQIDVDSPEVVSQMFVLLNLLGESMISVPSQVSNLYGSLPEGARAAIEKRDAPKT
jgi:Domain of unknown function (DUF4145)